MDNTNTNADLIAKVRSWDEPHITAVGIGWARKLADALEAAEAELTRRNTVITRAMEEAHALLRTEDVNHEEDNFAAGQVDAAECIRRVLAAAPLSLEAPSPEDVQAAVAVITRTIGSDTSAWNVWNNINTDPAFVSAFQRLHTPSLEAVKAETTTEWGIEYGPLDWSPRPVNLMRDEASCARFLKDPPLWSTPLHTQNAVIVHRQSATPWRPVETGGDNRV